MGLQRDPGAQSAFWGRSGASTITQPPMYGHAIAELQRRGVAVPGELVERAVAGVEWLLRHRRRERGLVICHPWESGCDDSPAWDAWCDGPWSRERWYVAKGRLVASLVVDVEGAAVANPAFEVASPGFEALVAFNALELGLPLPEFVPHFAESTSIRRNGVEHGSASSSGPVSSPDGRPRPAIDRGSPPPTESVPNRWVEAPTLEGLLGCLVDDRPDVLALALDDATFGGRFGPAGVRRDHPAFDPRTYWRGPAWPQLTYLLWVAARRFGHEAAARELATRLVDGAARSGFAEFWHPDTGEPLGARPQSWSTLAAVVA
jgi:hypothetical protein